MGKPMSLSGSSKLRSLHRTNHAHRTMNSPKKGRGLGLGKFREALKGGPDAGTRKMINERGHVRGKEILGTRRKLGIAQSMLTD